MKALKSILVIATAILLIAPVQNSYAQNASALTKVASALTSSNGIAAGKALLGLYTQFKADGKFDVSNSNNIQNLISLASSIKGLKNGTQGVNTTSFVSGLINGSNSLVNKNNSTQVLNSLTSLANVDLSSLSSNLASAAAQSAVSGLLSKAGGSSSKTSDTASAATSQASSILSGLFSKL